ncbi:MAG: alpha/beta fold hydrolase [Lautropia sp.]
MTTREVDRIVYECDGAGDAVLMVHGLGGTSNTWAAMMPAFAAWQAIRIDLPGAGRSWRLDGELSIARLVDAVQRVADDAGVTRAHLVGHSMGCIVAMHLAAARPTLVRSLCLFGPLLAPPEAARAAIRARGRKALDEGQAGMQAIADALLEVSVATETRERRRAACAFVRESIMRQPPAGYHRHCEALAAATEADVGAIRCPTLLVTGDQDAIAPPQAVRDLGRRLHDASVEVLRGCGHWEPVEQPDECMTLVRQFLSRRR